MLTFRLVRRGLLLVALLALPAMLSAWGYWGHQRINRAAVLALPPAMRAFFYTHIDFVTEEAVMPDVRKYALGDRNEGPRHYLDVEEYEKPLDQLPRTPEEAKTAYDAAKLDNNGRLPWVILELHTRLTQAMKERKKDDILLLASDLGHYLADAHMPLHTSANHDGQLTGQKGVHALWEARLPEVFGGSYDFRVPEPVVIADPTAEVWRIIRDSHAAVDTVLAVEKQVRTELGPTALFEVDAQGAPRKNRFGQPVHSAAYVKRFHEQLHGMVARRLRASVGAVANFWYTAWVNAGKPELANLDSEAIQRAAQRNLDEELRMLKKDGKLIELTSLAEF